MYHKDNLPIALKASEEATNVLDQINRSWMERAWDIPFENSDYQEFSQVIAAEQTPARSYRHLLLRMRNKIDALDELKNTVNLLQIELEELKHISDTHKNDFTRRKALVKIQSKTSKLDYVAKLTNDAIHSLSVMYGWLQKFPTYTREQFESEEKEHFDKLAALGNFKPHETMQYNNLVAAPLLDMKMQEWDAQRMLSHEQQNMVLAEAQGGHNA